MRLTHVCLLTNDVRGLADFYTYALSTEPSYFSELYVEFKLGTATISLYSQRDHEELAPGSSVDGPNPAMLIELEVDDVDKLHDQFTKDGLTIVKPPTTQPWGNRSIYIRDPAGNLLNFYTRVLANPE